MSVVCVVLAMVNVWFEDDLRCGVTVAWLELMFREWVNE